MQELSRSFWERLANGAAASDARPDFYPHHYIPMYSAAFAATPYTGFHAPLRENNLNAETSPRLGYFRISLFALNILILSRQLLLR